jgi:hypothetical protein
MAGPVAGPVWSDPRAAGTLAVPARRHGDRHPGHDARGAYIYPDATGTYRGFVHGEAGPTITVAFPSEDPADVLVPASPFTHLVNTYAGAVPVFCCSAMSVLHAVMAVVRLPRVSNSRRRP